jgi:hypothetical protein
MVRNRAGRVAAGLVLTASTVVGSMGIAATAQATQPRACNSSGQIPLTRQSGTNPAYPDLRLLACVRLPGNGNADTSLDVTGTPTSFMRVNWRVEAHSCNPDRGLSARGYIADPFSGDVARLTSISVAMSSGQTYKSNGRIESIYVVDTHGSVFTGGGIGATSPCL